ncbi:helix-turn-helix domain-containing protein [Vibrio vulnificus]|uniref:XRE family transcriptional regulator n=1 Tax=Vibrio vulnificus TaxID=672 RepID=UPI00102ADCCB|nr:XRE family transcriptional regulator [Vibrio vulnificus]MCU8168394.1 helix-turn-helix domain-containing protein [Vibrio vulnificus]MCU8172957.1 helix-turn-helix domain-containing protein [Vibrio vulnificus]RZR39409.1 XRE family transcriptional regulator [Vibrio vulnificus]
MRFSDRLKTHRKLKGLTQTSIAQSIGLSKVAISRWERGHSVPSGDILKVLAKILEVDVEWLLTGKNNLECESVALVDFYDDVVASAGNGYSNESERAEQYPLPVSIVNNEGAKNLACIRVKGKSMMPVLADGSIVALNTNKNLIRDGMMYVIRQGDLLRVKILIETPEHIIIRSYNPDFKDEYFAKHTVPDEDFVIVGQVIWHSSYLGKNQK